MLNLITPENITHFGILVGIAGVATVGYLTLSRRKRQAKQAEHRVVGRSVSPVNYSRPDSTEPVEMEDTLSLLSTVGEFFTGQHHKDLEIDNGYSHKHDIAVDSDVEHSHNVSLSHHEAHNLGSSWHEPASYEVTHHSYDAGHSCDFGDGGDVGGCGGD